MPTHEEYLNLVQRLAALPPETPYARLKRTERADRAKSALEHPGWMLFESQIQDRIDAVTQERDAKVRLLLASTEATTALEPLRHTLRHLEGQLLALSYCLDVLPDIVRQAETPDSPLVTSGNRPVPLNVSSTTRT